MKHLHLLLFFVCSFMSVQAQNFDLFLTHLSKAPDSLKQVKVDSFYQSLSRSPLIEQDTLVTFIYRGSASLVSWAGDANGWDPTASPFEKVLGTNLWFCRETYEPDARLDYKLVINNNNWILDPKNPYTIRGGYGPNSELRMPKVIFPQETVYRMDIQHGSTRDTTFSSDTLGNNRRVKIYLPPNYATSEERFPCIIFHDGFDYVSLGSAVNVIDNLIDDKKIRPLIALFIPAVNRSPEYAGEQRVPFADFVVNEILLWAKSNYPVLDGPENMAVMGASNGGNISLYMVLSFPGVFGKVAAQSSNVEDYISAGFLQAEKQDLQFYLGLGTYDLPILLPRVRNFVPILEQKGYDYFYKEYPEGHSWGFWRAHIDDILVRFFPFKETKVGRTNSAQPALFSIKQNYPNPFNNQTRIDFQIGRSCQCSIEIFNLLGEKVKTLFHKNVFPGHYSIIWDGYSDLQNIVSSGIYFFSLLIDGQFVERRGMVLLK